MEKVPFIIVTRGIEHDPVESKDYMHEPDYTSPKVSLFYQKPLRGNSAKIFPSCKKRNNPLTVDKMQTENFSSNPRIRLIPVGLILHIL